MAESVSIARVGKTFQTPRAPLPVLHQVQLEIAAGEFVAVLGPSGCGKSTLLRLIAGVDPRCAVMFQEPRLFPWKTVAAYVALGARRRADALPPGELLDLVGLTGFDRSYPYQLSGGMAQRASLARALIGHPEVLLLDEPFASLDALTRMRMQDLLVDACRRLRPTVVMVTHDVDEALYLADRIVIMGPRPASIAAVMNIPGTRPRDRADLTTASLRAEILFHFGFAHAASGNRAAGAA